MTQKMRIMGFNINAACCTSTQTTHRQRLQRLHHRPNTTQTTHPAMAATIMQTFPTLHLVNSDHSPGPLQHQRLLCSSSLFLPSTSSLYIAVMFTTPGTLTLITTPPPRCFSNCFPSRSAELASSFSNLSKSPPNSRRAEVVLTLLSVARRRTVGGW